MRFSLADRAWVTFGLALAASCKYDPTPPEGEQQCYYQGNQGKCVDGYVCGYDGFCYTPANLPVAPGTGGSTLVGVGGKTGSGEVIGYGGVSGKGGATGCHRASGRRR